MASLLSKPYFSPLKGFPSKVIKIVLACSPLTMLVHRNSTNNAFICPLSANAFCAGMSLTQNIIIRCTNGVGQPGNCNDK